MRQMFVRDLCRRGYAPSPLHPENLRLSLRRITGLVGLTLDSRRAVDPWRLPAAKTNDRYVAGSPPGLTDGITSTGSTYNENNQPLDYVGLRGNPMDTEMSKDRVIMEGHTVSTIGQSFSIYTAPTVWAGSGIPTQYN